MARSAPARAGSAVACRSASTRASGLRPGVPEAQQRERVDRVAARVPRAVPDLEVQVRAGRLARTAHLADSLPGANALALGDHYRTGPKVHEDVVAALTLAVEHDVVPRPARLVLDRLDHAAAR